MKNTQTEMGKISNLITDMTLKGATQDELARAVRHSMVVIDAEKHKLDYKKSEQDNGITALKKKYQAHENDDGYGGAATLISRAKSETSVLKRKGSPIIDKETGELVEQDIIRGTQIEFIEHGYDNPLTQYMVIKNDGTYANKMMFANDYTIQIRSANFPATEPVEITIKGNTTYDFEVIPYLRIKDVQIKIEGDEVVATAKVEKTTGHKITRIGLYAHQNQQVGEQMRQLYAEWPNPEDGGYVAGNECRLSIPISTNKHLLKPGTKFYFRVGAQVDASEAKLNYAPAIQVAF